MAFIDQLNAHRAIRQYRPDPVPEELLDEILAAGGRASSSGNMQTYSIIVTQDRGLREQLYVPHMEQNRVLDAPVLVTFCADFHRMRHSGAGCEGLGALYGHPPSAADGGGGRDGKSGYAPPARPQDMANRWPGSGPRRGGTGGRVRAKPCSGCGGPVDCRSASGSALGAFYVDVLDPAYVPAVSYPAPNGVSADVLGQIFRRLAKTGQVAAVSVSTWNPEMDAAEVSRRVCMDLLRVLVGCSVTAGDNSNIQSSTERTS